MEKLRRLHPRRSHQDGAEPPVDAIVADSILPWAANLGDAINVPVSSFSTQAAAVLLSPVHFGEFDDSEQAVANLTGH